LTAAAKANGTSAAALLSVEEIFGPGMADKQAIATEMQKWLDMIYANGMKATLESALK
jgi:mannitol-1-phosphate/altronate dehydrogenase